MDLSTPVTDQEYQVFAEFCLEKGIDLDGDIGQKNGTLFGNHLVSRNQRISQANLEAIYPGIKNQIAHAPPPQADYNRLSTYFSASERDDIAGFISQQGLDVGDHL